MKHNDRYKIAVAGAGYVGLSMAVLLSQRSDVCIYDPVKEKIDMINNRISPIVDEKIEEFFATKDLSLCATEDERYAYSDADFVIIAVPTDYDTETQFFDTSVIEMVLEHIRFYNQKAVIVIKSTVPVGYTCSI